MASSRHLVDPELAAGLDMLPRLDITPGGLAQTRATILETTKQALNALGPFPGVTMSERKVPGPKGAPDVRVLIFKPDKPSTRAGFFHIHGGGYVIGAPEISIIRNRMIARDIGCTVVSVAYRLAPETSFPGNIEDCYAGLKWFHANAESLGVDKNRIAIGGESAGGGLAAGLALLARDRGEIPIFHQHLIYPMIDDRTGSVSDPHPYTGEYVWTPADNRFGWRSILGHEPGGSGVSPYAAAARAESLAGLPATYISVGTLDLFLEENLEYARRLARAGVPVELHVYPGAFHGLEVIPDARVTKLFGRDNFEGLRHALTKS